VLPPGCRSPETESSPEVGDVGPAVAPPGWPLCRRAGGQPARWRRRCWSQRRITDTLPEPKFETYAKWARHSPPKRRFSESTSRATEEFGTSRRGRGALGSSCPFRTGASADARPEKRCVGSADSRGPSATGEGSERRDGNGHHLANSAGHRKPRHQRWPCRDGGAAATPTST